MKQWNRFVELACNQEGLGERCKGAVDGNFQLRCARFFRTVEQALLRNTGGQDLVEYALLAGFVAVAAGALLPGISASISAIFSKMGSALSAAGS
jgi:pilus assembly protein Flp/PilA